MPDIYCNISCRDCKHCKTRGYCDHPVNKGYATDVRGWAVAINKKGHYKKGYKYSPGSWELNGNYNCVYFEISLMGRVREWVSVKVRQLERMVPIA